MDASAESSTVTSTNKKLVCKKSLKYKEENLKTVDFTGVCAKIVETCELSNRINLNQILLGSD